MKIDIEKLEYILNAKPRHNVFTENGKIRWYGKIPEGIELVALFENTFLSEKNKITWINQVNNITLPIKLDTPSIDTTINLEELITAKVSTEKKIIEPVIEIIKSKTVKKVSKKTVKKTSKKVKGK